MAKAKYANIVDNRTSISNAKNYPYLLNCYDENNCLVETFQCKTHMEAYARGVYWVEDEKPDYVQTH